MSSAERRHRRDAVRRAAAVLLVVVLAVACAKGARTEVLYEREPAALTDDLKALIAHSSTGTACGEWPQSIGPSVAPTPPSDGGAVWADAGAFHVSSNRFFVRTVRIEVDRGTAQVEGGQPQASLVVPIAAGGTVTFTVSCDARAISVHFVGAEGGEFTDVDVVVGAGSPVRSPVRITKGVVFAASSGCSTLYEGGDQFLSARTDEEQAAALRRLIDVGRTLANSKKLSSQERSDVTQALDVGEQRLAAVERHDKNALSEPSPKESAAIEKVATVLGRLCPARN